MRCDRRTWLAWTAAAVTGGALTRDSGAAVAATATQPDQALPAPALPPSIARIADVAIDERVEPALIFLPRLP